MKIIRTKSTAATLILAASVIPAFSQSRGRESDRGFQRSGRPAVEQQRSFRAPAEQRNPGRANAFQGRAVQPEQRFQPQYQQRQFEQSRRTYGPQDRFTYRNNRYVIPQNRFYSSFGRDHFFRIGRPVFYGRYPRFQYGGFWFSFASLPPAYWGPNWYYNDDVYIDYSDGGYFLFDNRYPGAGIPLEVDDGSDVNGAPPDATYDAPAGDAYSEPYPGTY
ncbi:MAG TPA: hypothetical protein VHC90_11915 [Bryobacteraceae bacterium]|nr:hypothetical protein [Bryobacteraceae bacterium]